MTRETAASSAWDQATTGQDGHAPACWPAAAPLQPRTMPMTGPGPMKPPAA